MSPTSTASLARDTATSVRIAVGAFKRRVQEATAEGELSTPQVSVLARLERHGPATTAELARWAQITPQAMGATVTGLERLGLLARSTDAADGRRAILTLTDSGRDAVLSGRSALVERTERALTASFTRDEIATLHAALPLLERLADLI